MKKILAILLAAMMLLSLAACGDNETPSGSEGDKPGTSQGGENNDDVDDPYSLAAFEHPFPPLRVCSTKANIL